MSKKLNVSMVQILTQPIVPMVLHGINPRTIMGQYRWNKLKQEYKLKADHHCMICEAYVKHIPGDWLELHEKYEYDFTKRIQKLTGYVSICHQCHMYIHQGLLGIQFQTGQISAETVNKILSHGDKLLEEFGIIKIEYPDHDRLSDPDWRLEFEGTLYPKDNQ